MSKGVPIQLQCGDDWWMQFITTDPDTGDAVVMTAPRMEIRRNTFGGVNSASPVLYSSETSPATIVLAVTAPGVVLATIAGALTKNQIAGQVGSWDCYATDPAGASVLLGVGSFRSGPNVTVL